MAGARSYCVAVIGKGTVPPSSPLLDRIRAKIDAPLSVDLLDLFFDWPFDPDACWDWTAAYSRGKRGSDRPVIWLGDRVANVARVMLSLKDGIPLDERDGLEAAHSCDRAPCVNPFHLEWKTDGANKREQSERRRAAVEALQALRGSL